jgi:hypothetical protein
VGEAVEACRIANATLEGVFDAEDGRVLRWILLGRVEVANEAVAHGAMRDTGWRRTQKARAGRKVLVESIVVLRGLVVRGKICRCRVWSGLFGSTRIFQRFATSWRAKVRFLLTKSCDRQRRLLTFRMTVARSD